MFKNLRMELKNSRENNDFLPQIKTLYNTNPENFLPHRTHLNNLK